MAIRGNMGVSSGEFRVASFEWRVSSGEFRVSSFEWRVSSGGERGVLGLRAGIFGFFAFGDDFGFHVAWHFFVVTEVFSVEAATASE
jgi:hypothetical protein